jgi:glycerol kinase
MYKDTGIKIPALRVDGGAANNDYLMQFQADLIGTPVERAANLETTAMGAAFLAGLAVGFWSSTDELQHLAKIGKRFEPNMPAARRAKLYNGWQQAVQATMAFKPQLDSEEDPS